LYYVAVFSKKKNVDLKFAFVKRPFNVLEKIARVSRKAGHKDAYKNCFILAQHNLAASVND